jgi:hypothetical protein
MKVKPFSGKHGKALEKTRDFGLFIETLKH